VFGVSGGQNITLSSASLDGTALTKSNSNLTSSCGVQTYGALPSQVTGYSCTLTITFGPSLPAPATGTAHNLSVVTSDGLTSSFQVTTGYLYEATSTAPIQ